MNSQIIIYQTEDGKTKLDVRLENETAWLTQKLMAELFQTTSQNITIHLKNIFEEGELDEQSTCKEFLQVQKEGNRNVEGIQKFYNLDAGSGALSPVSSGMIKKVSESVQLPIITGGGIKTPEKALENCKAGSDIIVVGNAIEKSAQLIKEIGDAIKIIYFKN